MNTQNESVDQSSSSTPLVPVEVLNGLMARVESEGAELLGPDGLLSQVTKAVLERALKEELTDHLGYDKHDPVGRGSGNLRNATSPKERGSVSASGAIGWRIVEGVVGSRVLGWVRRACGACPITLMMMPFSRSPTTMYRR